MSYNYNRFKDTTIYGNLINSDNPSGNQANATFHRDLTVAGIINASKIQNNSGSNNLDISANIISNSLETDIIKGKSNLSIDFADINTQDLNINIGYKYNPAFIATTVNIGSKITYIYGTFQNKNHPDGYSANAYFEGNVGVAGYLFTNKIQNNASGTAGTIQVGCTFFRINAPLNVYGNNLSLIQTSSTNLNIEWYNSTSKKIASIYPNTSLGNFYFDISAASSQVLTNFVFVGGNVILPTNNTIGNYAATTSFVNTNYQPISGMSNYLLSSTASSTYQPIANMSNYLLNTTASSTYQPIANMSNYLSNSTASSTYQTISGMSNYLLNTTASSTYQPIANMSNYQTVSGMSNYLSTSTASSTYQTISGMSNYLSSSTASSTYQTISGMNNYLSTSTAASTYQPISNMSNYPTLSANNTLTGNNTFNGTVILPTTNTIGNYAATTSFVNSNYQTISGMSNYLSTSTASSTYQPISGMSNYLLSSTASSTYQPISSMSNYLSTSTASSTYQPIANMSNYLSTSTASSTYQPISSMSNYLSNTTASSTYQTISGMSNYIQNGGNIPFNTNIAKLSFLSTFPTTSVNDNTTGIGFYWNQSGGQGETDLICYGQASGGGLSIWGAGNTTAPNQIAYFYPNNIQLFSNPIFPTNNTIGNYGATTSFVNSNYQTISGMSNYLTSSSASSIYQTISNMNNYPTLSANNTFTATTNTFNGKLVIGNSSQSEIYVDSTTDGLKFTTSSNFVFTGGPVSLGTGYRGRQGTNNMFLSNSNTMNTYWTGSALQAWVDISNLGNFTICDYRIKENIQPCSNVLDRLCSVNMFNYELKNISIFKKSGNHIGFFAHELQEAFPELNNIVSGEKDKLTDDGEIQPQTINAEFSHLLMKSIQELNEKIIQLTNRITELEKINK